MRDQVYSTLAELYSDLDLEGSRDEASAFGYLRSASEWIEQRLGNFIPYTETRRIDGNGQKSLFLDVPLLSATPTVTNDGTTLAATDFLLYPRDRHWPNGPYTRITVDPDASGLAVWLRERDAVTIAGKWGKYDESVSLGITVENATQQAAADAVLVVSNGGSISPGMVLLIESEQELVTGYSGTGTDSALTVNGAHANNVDVILLSGATINPGEVIRIVNEQMYVDRMEGNSVLVRRGWNGTTRAAIVTGAQAFVYRTFAVKRGIHGTTAADHTNGTAISRYFPPSQVNFLARQISAIMLKKAKTGFAGKVATIGTGGGEEIFYFNEFPKSVYEEIRKNFRC